MTTDWKAAWFAELPSRATDLWRGVEAQHIIATMKLVDSDAEQVILERLLESSKPPLPPGASGQHYLIFTPYRYRPPAGTRFTHPNHAGVWYGAEQLETACAEVAYWRWRFLIDSDGLADQALHTEHTFFRAHVRGSCIDLTIPPWDSESARWKQKTDYSDCRALADHAFQAAIGWIRYQSVRAISGNCGAVLDMLTLSLPADIQQQTWACKTTRQGAYLRHATSGMRHEFQAVAWQ